MTVPFNKCLNTDLELLLRSLRLGETCAFDWRNCSSQNSIDLLRSTFELCPASVESRTVQVTVKRITNVENLLLYANGFPHRNAASARAEKYAGDMCAVRLESDNDYHEIARATGNEEVPSGAQLQLRIRPSSRPLECLSGVKSGKQSAEIVRFALNRCMQVPLLLHNICARLKVAQPYRITVARPPGSESGSPLFSLPVEHKAESDSKPDAEGREREEKGAERFRLQPPFASYMQSAAGEWTKLKSWPLERLRVKNEEGVFEPCQWHDLQWNNLSCKSPSSSGDNGAPQTLAFELCILNVCALEINPWTSRALHAVEHTFALCALLRRMAGSTAPSAARLWAGGLSLELLTFSRHLQARKIDDEDIEDLRNISKLEPAVLDETTLPLLRHLYPSEECLLSSLSMLAVLDYLPEVCSPLEILYHFRQCPLPKANTPPNDESRTEVKAKATEPIPEAIPQISVSTPSNVQEQAPPPATTKVDIRESTPSTVTASSAGSDSASSDAATSPTEELCLKWAQWHLRRNENAETLELCRHMDSSREQVKLIAAAAYKNVRMEDRQSKQMFSRMFGGGSPRRTVGPGGTQ